MPSPVEELIDPRLGARGVRLLLKRDDLIDPEIPGNKWRKLKYNIQAARRSGHGKILTFGGAYSNHIRATAAAGALFGLRTVGVIRGEEHLPLNPTLSYAVEQGMTLAYLDRGTYRRKMESDVIGALHRRFGDFYLIPEGGSNGLAVRGCAEIPDEITQDFDFICCPCGTGGTLAGIAAGLHGDQEAIGFSVLKGAGWLNDEIRRLQEDAHAAPRGRWHVNLDYHFGGYAKTKPELLSFVEDFEKRHGLRLDRLYTGKMMYGIFDLAGKRTFPPGTTIVAVITGPI
ncbi:1-aminocyclopropane-1-carboxylate deaminase/D-cysteine desulfhydrase [Microbispora triticiradicis]|uniref:1-aminocyclopropane-1-carboxylate deaminase/D-cysteine desulfhydrase n=1 Tax=Microbispora triticiradicis TaxID=2200763 RepID=A0ABX9LLW4_9ACTN|nr:1-aminocyclopropane-1-carboxylate deaminase/D-cysteine desulfhydrase [Microbispora triticiradicis]